MKLPLIAVLALLATLGATALASEVRVVALDGTTTEIVSALGARDELVGRDDSSYYPASVTALPSVGYQFSLDGEGILSLRPTLVIGRDDVKPQAAIDQVRDAGVRVVLLPQELTIAGAQRKIRDVGVLLGRQAQARRLISAMNRSLALLDARITARGHEPPARVLVLLDVSPATLFACGPDSGPGASVALAGATNALPHMHGCKPATSEAIVAAQPTVIVALDTDRRGVSPQSLDRLPGVAQTPAARSHREYVLDALYVAGFGPRLGDALLSLFNDFYPARR